MSNRRAVCMYCGQGDLAGGMVISSKPSEGDYHFDPHICRRLLSADAEERQRHQCELEQKVKALHQELSEAQARLNVTSQHAWDRRAEIITLTLNDRGLQAAHAEKAKYIEVLEKRLEAWKHSGTSAYQELADVKLKLRAALEANRAHIAASQVLVDGSPLLSIPLPTDQASWDKAAPYIARALTRYNHITL